MAAASRETLEAAVLGALSASASAGIPDSHAFVAAYPGADHSQLASVLKSLENELFVATTSTSTLTYDLTAEAETVISGGSPEWRLWDAVPAGADGASMAELEAKVGKSVVKIGMGPAMKAKWLKKAGANLCRASDAAVADALRDTLVALRAADGAEAAAAGADMKSILKRKLVAKVTRKVLSVSRGTAYAPTRAKLVADVTAKMLADGSWGTTRFKPYNFKALGTPVGGGYFHPLLKVRAEFRRMLMEMGFEEMPTNRWVESSFWNFDALFQPQSHPARDAHDTFFIKDDVAETVRTPAEYYERVKETHENGGTSGSIGHGYEFDHSEARKNLLRTHTTAVSARMLQKLGAEYKETGVFTPKKYFSIDRVFRNETTDATHLCEFHQVEFFIADRGLSLGDLMGTIKAFFGKLGITDLRFKPAFNPYTEPSMEVFGYHPDLGKWTELGNSGMFRPEMLEPMGLPSDVRVIAGGLSLERPTMIKYRCKNIRELFGHKASMLRTKRAPIARFP